MEKITGYCQHCVFFSETTLFGVYRFKGINRSEKGFVVTGSFPRLEEDASYDMEGEFVEHPKYGIQFQVTSIKRNLPTEQEGIVRYLSSSAFYGIGEKTAQAIVDRLGENTLSLIREDPNVLYQIPELNDKKIKAILAGFQANDGLNEHILQYFLPKGFSMKQIVKLISTYGNECILVFEENPYRFVYEVDGIGFKTVDEIAVRNGIDPYDINRLEALLTSLVMNMCMRYGDTYVEYNELVTAYEKETYTNNLDEILEMAIFNGHLVNENNHIYHFSQFQAETYIASNLNLFPFEQLEPYDKMNYDQLILELQENENIIYDSQQLNAIKTFFDEDFMILTGGPGTGKTTVVKAMTALFAQLYPSYHLSCIAPTGRAAKRLSELCDVESYTIHSILQWNLETNTFGRNEENPLLTDVLIIDEFSMVDNYLFYNLLKACQQVKKICIIGDTEQLPSVSCGDLLNDLIKSKVFPVIQLEHIYRQTNGSDIVSLAHDISINEVDFKRYTKDIIFFECDKYNVKNNVSKVVSNALEKGYNINDIQVLSSMYKGVAGIDRLNNALQEQFNPYDPFKNELKFQSITFREHDKILQLKNQPDDNVFNGDIGIIEEIVYENEIDNKSHIFARFDNNIVEYTQDTYENITLAYCISVHKSQGSEYPIVIMPIVSEQSFMLQRKLVYTGITRAKSALILLGEKNWFDKAVSISEKHIRKTGLLDKLCIREGEF